MTTRSHMIGISRRRLLRYGASLITLPVCLWFLHMQMGPLLLSHVPAQIAAVSPTSWGLAAALSALSLWSVGRYDGVAHRHLQTGVPDTQARRAGTVVIALSQTLGFGIATGAAARWRMLPGLSCVQAVALSMFVTASFLAGWSILTALMCLLLPAPGWTQLPAIAVLAVLPITLWCGAAPGGALSRLLRLPTLRASAAILGWTALDTFAAALALYVLLPPGVDVGFLTLLPVYLLAIGAALISGSPGGVGPFELVLLGLLPDADPVALLSGIIAFRLCYYAGPAVMALLAMARPLPFCRPTEDHPLPTLIHAPRAEVGVIRQNGGWLMSHGTSGASAVWATRQTLTALHDPIAGTMQDALNQLRSAAAARNLIPCLYKTTARCVLAARQARWQVLHLADEAVLDPLEYTLAHPARRRLRRKLRQAAQAGITCPSPRTLPVAAMEIIDRAWQKARGPARARTMGQFDPAYLATQHVVLAWQGGQLAGFASFHTSSREWCLDLMRADPDGTMQAVLHHAITEAQTVGMPRLSLAAVPACPDPTSALHRWVARQVITRAGGPGLRQFKSAFAPRWQPLYAAAPSRLGLMLALLDIAWTVRSAPPVTTPRPTNASPSPHDEDENYEFAPARAS